LARLAVDFMQHNGDAFFGSRNISSVEKGLENFRNFFLPLAVDSHRALHKLFRLSISRIIKR
jgi:hypothetical protein